MSTLSVIYKIGADISGLQQGVERAAVAAEGLQAGFASVGTAIAGAFTAEKIIAFGTEAVELGAHLQDLEGRTGIAVEALQELSMIASENGSNIDTLAGSINQMQKRLSGGDQGAVQAVNELGLSLQGLMAMTPEKQFYEIADAIKTIEDPAKQVELGWKVFGKSFGEVKAAVLADTDEIRRSTAKMSDDDSKALKDLENTAGRVFHNMVTWAGEAVAAIWSIPATAAIKAKQDAQAAEDLIKQMHDMAGKAQSPFAGMMDQNSPKPVMLDDTSLKYYTKGLEELAAASIKANEEQQKFGATVREVTAFAKGFGAVVDTIDGQVLEGIRYYKERGESLQKISELYGLLPEQVSALNEQFAFEQSIVNATTREFSQLGVAIVQDVQMPLDDLTSSTLPQFDMAVSDSVTRIGGLGQQVGVFEGDIKQAKVSVDRLGTTLGDISSILSGVHGNAWIDVGKIAVNTVDTMAQRLAKGDVLGAAIALGAGLVSVFSRVGSQIKSFFNRIFGGPSGDELAGRDLVAKFQANFSSVDDMLAKVADAMKASGGTAEQAQALIKAMWDAEKSGAVATAAAIQKVQDALNGATAAQNAFNDAAGNSPANMTDITDSLPPSAIGMASGGMGRTTGPTWFYSGGDEDFAFSGEGKGFGGGGGNVTIHVQGSVVTERELAGLVSKYQDRDLRLRYKMAAA